jgi:hypothetical protein
MTGKLIKRTLEEAAQVEHAEIDFSDKVDTTHLCGLVDVSHLCRLVDKSHLCKLVDMSHLCTLVDTYHLCILVDMSHLYRLKFTYPCSLEC